MNKAVKIVGTTIGISALLYALWPAKKKKVELTYSIIEASEDGATGAVKYNLVTDGVQRLNGILTIGGNDYTPIHTVDKFGPYTFTKSHDSNSPGFPVNFEVRNDNDSRDVINVGFALIPGFINKVFAESF